MGFLDDVGDGLEGLYDDGKKGLGATVDAGSHLVGGALDTVGLHDAAHAVDNWGDSVADNLGAQVGELQLGDSDDPKDLVHGDAKALSDAADHLRTFHDAFEETGSGLRAMDSSHWQGQAADAFRTRFAPHPGQWLTAADACAAAAQALDGFSHTVTWAQGQAKRAIDAYNAAKKTHEQARNAYNASVDSYNKAAKAWNDAAKSNPNPGPKPTDPGDFHDDAGNAQLAHAQDLLRDARTQRDTAADSAAKALQAATATAPTEPSFTQRMKLDSIDAAEGGMIGVTHVYGGIAKGAADIVNFGRGLNPMDPYNATHPATYLDHVNQVAVGLVHAEMHPTDVVKSLVGSDWGSDPAEAGGKLLTNLVFGAATDGAGTEADASLAAAKDTAENAAKDAAESGADRGGASAVDHPAPAPDPEPDRLAAAVDRSVDITSMGDNIVWRDSREAVWRFTDRDPQKIVADGGMTPWKPENNDLAQYVRDERYRSAFTGTTNDPGYQIVRQWKYTIDAPGGIDVNASIPDNVFHDEHEIAFPGGIKLEHIQGWQRWNPLDQKWGNHQPNPYYKPPLPSPPANGLPPGWTR
ncbi:putative T7SS-secreted protein [Kitasatospora sp. GAS204B]|uniref:putative T7SS-secreted protein n=1 Tax=unclassified Kitasatospora TaxID=2633591 RepID=UPI0024759806|nr:hypothetical protein [Kitasatospora sp. GAS204B]MDH6122080.1 hypothetical protein [Kitasatospora sp. GAS204B]